MTLRRQMILAIAGSALVIYVLILGVSAARQYSQSKREVERAMTRLAASYSARLDAHLREAGQIAEAAARFMATDVEVSDDVLYELLENNVSQSQSVYGSCLAFEPGSRRPAPELFAPYVCRDGDALKRMNINDDVYDWYRDPNYTWYRDAKNLNAAVWSKPYFDEGAGGILMSTYSAPFSNGDQFGGVCTVDIDLPRLRQTVAREFEDELEFVIIESDGKYVYHRDAARIMNRDVFDYLADAGQANVITTVRRMIESPAASAWVDGWESREPLGVFSARIPSTGWTFVALVPERTVLADVRHRTIENAVALVAALALICGAIYWVAGRIAAPITQLEQGVTSVGGGQLETRIDDTTGATEIRNVARSFNRMTAELRSILDRLAAEHAARERIEHDLDIARGIQQSLLPTVKPQLSDYDIAGWSQPANKTGGDYYDWQTLPDGRLLVSLADVSGHGVGPALVAAVCRAYARATVTGNKAELSCIVNRLNNLLVDDMPDGRFITFAGVLIDPNTHEAQLISAGHGPLFRCVRANGELYESGGDGIPLGLMPENEYGPGSRFVLAPGDAVLLVTDGLFEGTNAEGEPFGLDRLRSAIRGAVEETAEKIIDKLTSRMLDFVGQAEQADDITIVVVRRNES